MNIDSNKWIIQTYQNPWKGFNQVEIGGDIYQQISNILKLPNNRP